jgi:hypothetical protein
LPPAAVTVAPAGAILNSVSVTASEPFDEPDDELALGVALGVDAGVALALVLALELDEPPHPESASAAPAMQTIPLRSFIGSSGSS